MAEEISITRLKREQEARRAGVMAWVQSVLILLLLVGIAEDYNHNQYLQAWTAVHLAGLGFLLNGTLAAFYMGILTAVFFKGPLPRTVRWKMKRKEPPVPQSEARFYDEIASNTSELRNNAD